MDDLHRRILAEKENVEIPKLTSAPYPIPSYLNDEKTIYVIITLHVN